MRRKLLNAFVFEHLDFEIKALGYKGLIAGSSAICAFYFMNDSFFMGEYIFKNPLTDNGIYYCHDEEDILKGYAMIMGPEGTPYFGGYYFFEFSYCV